MLLHGVNKCGVNHCKPRAWRFHCLLIIVPMVHEWVLIDLMQLISSPHVTKHETDGGWKSGYYVAILSGQNDRSLWSELLNLLTIIKLHCVQVPAPII